MDNRIINNNSPDPLARPVIGNFKRINPDKFTFLTSNQLIPSYINQGNVRYNSQTKPSYTTNSYDSSEMERIDFIKKVHLNNTKIQNALRKAKAISNEFFISNQEKEHELGNEIKQIANMVENMNFKAADIMNGRMLETFSRKTIDITHKELKNLKEGTFQQKLFKTEHTRKLMKKTYNHLKDKIVSEMSKNDKIKENQTIGSSFFSSNDSSFLSSLEATKDELFKDNHKYKKLRKDKSFQSIYNAERRKATQDAFACFWKQGAATKTTEISSLFEEKASPKRTSKAKTKKSHHECKSAYESIENSHDPVYINNMAYSSLFLSCVDGFALNVK